MLEDVGAELLGDTDPDELIGWVIDAVIEDEADDALRVEALPA